MEKETHVLVFPFPIQGHINPMLQFSKRLTKKGLKVTVISTTITATYIETSQADSINVQTIFNGFKEGEKVANPQEFMQRYNSTVPHSLAELIEKYTNSSSPVKCVIYDSIQPWAFDVARSFGIFCASFFTQSCAVTGLYYKNMEGEIKFPLKEDLVSLACFPELELDDLPSFVHGPGPYPAIYDLMFKQFYKIDEVDWLLWNTFNDLEDELPYKLATDLVNVATVCDCLNQGKDILSVQDYLTNFKNIMLPNLTETILSNSVSCVVYDSFVPWIADVAKESGLSAAPFFAQSCAVGCIYCSVYEGRLGTVGQGQRVDLPALPTLSEFDLPSFISDSELYPGSLGLVTDQFSNLDKADWILFNTFYSLENEVVNWMASKWAIKPIGPTIPSMFLDKRLEDEKDYGLSLFKPNSETCMQWLDSKPKASVIYISFGSLAALGEDQMEQVALGLKQTNKSFLWVVRETEVTKLPKNFIEETKELGLVVNWSPQLQVLAHESVGCFVTHCGWNSTLEALSLGVPMVAMPQWTDQPTNAKYVADVWGVGVRVEKDEKGIVTKEEIERCISEVMDSEKGEEMRRNSEKWKKLAREAVDEGGSSDRNIDEFVQKLKGEYFVTVNG